MIRLIVTADDVGLDEGITEGALTARQEGIVMSLSVLVARSDWASTAERLQEVRPLDVGVHLTLCEGRPALPPSEVPSLVEADGRFPLRLGTVLRRHATRRLKLSEVRREWLAQVRRAQHAGLSVTHLDGHKHIHLLPGLFGVALDVRQGCGVPGMRLPREPGKGPRTRVRQLLRFLSARGTSRLVRTGAVTTDRTAGIGVAGALTESVLLELLARLRPGTTELITHPGRPGRTLPSALLAEGLGWTGDYRFADELAALTSPAVRDVIASRGIELIGWRDLLAT